MRFGVCAGPEKAEVLAEAGYDFIELSLAGDLMAAGEDSDWQAARARLLALPLPPETFNSFVRVGKIAGPDVDFSLLTRYVQTALARAAEIGGKIIVFGSGGARNVPEGFDRETAARQIREFLDLCADVSEQTGVVVAIEPLRRAESNIINLVSEGAHLARQIARPGVRDLGDTYHMEQEGEPLSALVEARDVLAHVHVADTGRLAPGTGVYDYVSLFGALRDAGYDARVSIECGFGSDFAGEVGYALTHLRTAYDAANNGEVEDSA